MMLHFLNVRDDNDDI